MKMRARTIALLLLSVGFLNAQSCKDLCERFGDYEGCRKLEQGVADCTRQVPVHMTPASVETGVRTTDHVSNRTFSRSFMLYTSWLNNGGANIRFRVKVSDWKIEYLGESHGEADDYGLKFDGKSFGDEHMIDAEEMRCRQIGEARYQCNGVYGEYRRATIEFRNEGRGRFELRFYGAPMNGRSGERYILRLASDGRYLYEEYFDNGRKRQDISRRYPIARIVPLP